MPTTTSNHSQDLQNIPEPTYFYSRRAHAIAFLLFFLHYSPPHTTAFVIQLLWLFTFPSLRLLHPMFPIVV